MSATIDHNIREQAGSRDSEAKTHALIAYILMTVGLFTAIPILVGAIWAMVKKKSARGTLYYSHFVNATRTFWWGLFWTVIGCLFLVAGVGVLILGLVWLWTLYRLIRGLATITADEAYPL